MKIGFIGIGVMGRPMTLNLLKAGYDVSVFARHPDKPEVQEVINAGARLAPSPRAVAMASEIVITMVPNSAQVEEVVAGEQGVLEGARKGLVIIDMSTIAPAMSRNLAELAATKEVSFLDAPVSGGSQGAVNGTLTIMVGGEQEVFERVRSVLVNGFCLRNSHEENTGDGKDDSTRRTEGQRGARFGRNPRRR